MNYRMIFNIIGQLLRVEAALMLLPLLVSFYYGEELSMVYGITMALLLIASSAMTAPKPKTQRIYAREGFVTVALSWILMSVFGALPFVLSGAIPSFTDALFETVSGFTTTGSTILTDIEALPKSILFWRSFTHWIGGMGVIVFVLAILPQKGTQSMHILRAEVPGPTVGKLVSKTAVTARILYLIYGALTVSEIICLKICGLPLYDSVTTAFSTAGTGGFSIMNASIAAYDNLAAEIVISIFMLMFGINFNLYYLLFMKQVKRIFKSEELWVYLGIVGAATLIIAADIYPLVNSVGTALRQSGFQVASVITTTGFITADFNKWPAMSQLILVVIMMIGSCAGSTGGGLKIGRVIILIKAGARELRRAVNPSRVKSIQLDSQVIEKETVTMTCTYFMIYMLITAVSALLISFNNFDITTTVTSVITCINNVGPGLSLVGPVENFAKFSDFSKIILSLDMLIGRLEIFPMILLFMPSVWKKSV